MKVAAGTALIGTILILASFTNCSARDSKYGFPEGCSPSGFEFRGDNLVLNTASGSEQSLYLFHNISGSDIWLNHPVEDPGASAGWASNLNTGNWSAFAVNKEGFVLSCSEMGQGSVKTLTCEKVLKVCRFENPVFKQGESGSYWVSEDKPLKAVLDETGSRGIGF